MEPAYLSSRDSQYWPEFSVKIKARRYVPKQMRPAGHSRAIVAGQSGPPGTQAPHLHHGRDPRSRSSQLCPHGPGPGPAYL